VIAALRRHITRLFEHRAVVLMYHRIADVALDPWALAVSPAHFEEQVLVLTKKFQVVPLMDMVRQLQQKKLASNAVCLTFDDGYADNALFAAPILERYKCPATFFIPSTYLDQQQPFWWDSLQALLLEAPQLPQLFQIPIYDDVFSFDLDGDAILTSDQVQQQQAWAWPDAPPTLRCRLYTEVWERLRPLAYPEIQTAIAAIKRWAGYTPGFPEDMLPMRAAHLQALAQNPLFTIGLHTVTHPALAYHPEEAQYHEIGENKKALQPYQPANAIAFPYGSYNNSTLSVLQKQRLDAGFTTEAHPVTNHTNPHCQGRFQVKNWNGAHFEKQLRRWLNA
jgi:peptidoglycan/xylan/chitin deacetylase (PgdA/CDA1 family)